jgi:SAM-dependent methyltransferase
MMMSDPSWYEVFFGEDYLRMYVPMLPPEWTEREVDGILTLLALPVGSSILDVCCGYGRHSISLASRGYKMTGQDLSEVLLREAQTQAQVQGVQVRWVQSDMRNIPFENEFDAAINMFTAFGYLETEDEDQKVLQQVSKALKPGGLFLLEIVHREGLLRNYASEGITRSPDGLLVLEERRFDLLTSRNEVQVTLIHSDGHRSEYNYSLRIYSLTELAQMLAVAELQVKAFYGTWNRSPLTMDNFRLILLSQKDKQTLMTSASRLV